MPPAERRTLASLRSGQFHAYGPSFGHDGVRLGQLALAQTRPPKAGKASTTLPAPSAAIRAVVPELEKIATTQNPDEVDTIEKARERIKALRVELVKAQKPAAPAAPAVDLHAVKVAAFDDGRKHVRTAVAGPLRDLVRTATDLCERAKALLSDCQSQRAALDAFTTLIEAPIMSYGTRTTRRPGRWRWRWGGSSMQHPPVVGSTHSSPCYDGFSTRPTWRRGMTDRRVRFLGIGPPPPVPHPVPEPPAHPPSANSPRGSKVGVPHAGADRHER